jgi:hypothetical protein
MSFAFQLGEATLDGPDGVDKLLQRVRGFRRQLGLIPDRLNRTSARFSWLLGMGNPLIVSIKGGRPGLFHSENG